MEALYYDAWNAVVLYFSICYWDDSVTDKTTAMNKYLWNNVTENARCWLCKAVFGTIVKKWEDFMHVVVDLYKWKYYS